MSKNKSVDLNNILFQQLERLNDPELRGDRLKEEAERARSITKVSHQVISNMALFVKVKGMIRDDEIEERDVTGMLEHEKW